MTLARNALLSDPRQLRGLKAAGPSGQRAFSALVEPHRRELQVHCYRMLGSLQDAEDLVQETLLRAWQKLETYQGRAPFRAWLYKIATNICLDALARRPRRTLPPLSRAPADPAQPLAPPVLEPVWLEPIPDDFIAHRAQEPAARYAARESITFAFLAALQFLPPRQRAILILRDVLDWDARQVAELLDLSVSAVNSALHRARATMRKHYRRQDLSEMRLDAEDQATRVLLERYVKAWEAADISELVALLRDDARFPMPPSPSWYRGREAIQEFVSKNILQGDAVGRWRLVPTRANGQPAFGWYRRVEGEHFYTPFAIHIVTVDSESHAIAEAITFPIPSLFAAFKLPPQLGA